MENGAKVPPVYILSSGCVMHLLIVASHIMGQNFYEVVFELCDLNRYLEVFRLEIESLNKDVCKN